MYTQAEMGSKYCPYQTQLKGSEIIKVTCDPEHCAMWRWTTHSEHHREEETATGFCGCAGQPHEFVP